MNAVIALYMLVLGSTWSALAAAEGIPICAPGLVNAPGCNVAAQHSMIHLLVACMQLVCFLCDLLLVLVAAVLAAAGAAAALLWHSRMLLQPTHQLHGVAGEKAVSAYWHPAATESNGISIKYTQVPHGIREHLRHGLLQQRRTLQYAGLRADADYEWQQRSSCSSSDAPGWQLTT